MAERPRRKRSALAPLFGLLIVIILGVIAWMVAPDMIHWLTVTLPGFAANGMPPLTLRAIFTAIIVLLTLIALALFAALASPRDDRRTSAAQLEKERDALRQRQRATRAQARKRKGAE